MQRQRRQPSQADSLQTYGSAICLYLMLPTCWSAVAACRTLSWLFPAPPAAAQPLAAPSLACTLLMTRCRLPATAGAGCNALGATREPAIKAMLRAGVYDVPHSARAARTHILVLCSLSIEVEPNSY